jgi:cobalt/nickel transport system permease protein
VTLALVPAFVGYPIALALRRALGGTAKGLALACGIAAAIAVELSAATFVGEFALGAAIDIDLAKIAWSTLGAYAVIALIEGVLTTLIVRALLSVRPDLVRIAEPVRAGWVKAPAPSRDESWSLSDHDSSLDAPGVAR